MKLLTKGIAMLMAAAMVFTSAPVNAQAATLNGAGGQTTYGKTVVKDGNTDITPSAALPLGTEGLGSVSQVKGSITVNAVAGYEEGAYAEWAPVAGADGYVVETSNDNGSTWSAIDNELIRKYAAYYRADAVGLSVGDYKIRIRAVKVSGTSVLPESNDVAQATASVTVTAKDRSGFAFTGKETPGAYKEDGTLKAGAKVFYITAATAKTVTTDVIIDSKGKTLSCTGLQAIFAALEKGYDKNPYDFRILGCIDAADMDSLGSSAEGLQIKATRNPVTLEGIGCDAAFKNMGMLLRDAQYTEVANLGVYYCLDDGVSLDTDNLYVWVHNMDIMYGRNKGGDQAKGDGALDCKSNSKYITMSYNHFWDTGKSSLCGMKSESGPNYITYHHNWFDHSDSRHPRIRTMSVHVYNNYYDGNAKYGVGVTTGADAFVEQNYFRNCKFPMMSSLQGSDVYAGTSAKGKDYPTFSGESGGSIKAYNNYIDGSNASYVAYGEATMLVKGSVQNSIFPTSTSVDFDAYEVSNRTDKVPATVVSFSGNDTYNNFDTTQNLGVKEANITPVMDVPTVVTQKAGRVNGGDFVYQGNKYIPRSAASDADHEVNATLSNAIKDYKSSLISVGGTNGAAVVQMYTVKVMNGETEISSTQYEKNTVIASAPATPEGPAGKTFGGWYVGETKVSFPYTVTASVTMAAKWLSTYTVSFDTDGGSAAPADKSVLEGNKVAKPADPTKAGFIFKGWYNQDAYFDFASAAISSNLTLKAIWLDETKVKTVTYMDGLSTFATRKVEEGEATPEISTTKTGYTFGGWFSDADLETSYDMETLVTADITIYGKWTKNTTPGGGGTGSVDGMKTITFGASGKTIISNMEPAGWATVSGNPKTGISVAYNGTTYTTGLKMESATKIDFDTNNANAELYIVSDTAAKIKLDGTAYTITSAGSAFKITIKEPGAHTLAKGDTMNVVYIGLMDGDPAPDHKVTFNLNGGDGLSELVVDTGKSLSETADYEQPTNGDYTFAGWFKDAKFTEEFSETEPVNTDITLYTYWLGPNGGTLSKVTYETNGGEIDGDKTVLYEEGFAIAEPEVTREESEYNILEGWYKTYDFTGSKFDFSQGAIGDFTLYAKWVNGSGVVEPIYYVVFDGNYEDAEGNEVIVQKTQGLHEGDSYSVTAPSPRRTGYAFTKWFKDKETTEEAANADYSGTVSDNNIVFYAGWDKVLDPVTISFKSDDIATKTYDAPFNCGTDNAFTVMAKADATVVVEANAKAGYVNRLKTGGVGSTDARAISFTALGAGKATIKAISSSSSATRPMALGTVKGGQLVQVGDTKTVSGSAVNTYTFDFTNPGVYFIYSQDGGINFYEVSVTYTPTVEDSYSVLFYSNGKLYEQQMLVSGSAIATPTAPERTAYIFKGWSKTVDGAAVDLTGATATSNAKYYAIWDFDSEHFYKVAFDSEGGSAIKELIVDKAATEPYSLATRVPTAPKGKKFDGWYTAAEGGEKVESLEASKFTTDATLYAHYTDAPTFTVTFDVQGKGTAPAAITVTEGDKLTAPAAPTAEGYNFGGWYKDAACASAWKLDTDTVTEDVTLYAYWVKKSAGTQLEITDAASVKFDASTTLNSLVGEDYFKITDGDVNASTASFDITETEKVSCAYRFQTKKTGSISFKVAGPADVTICAKSGSTAKTTDVYLKSASGTEIGKKTLTVTDMGATTAKSDNIVWTVSVTEPGEYKVCDDGTNTVSVYYVAVKVSSDIKYNTVKFDLNGHGSAIADAKVVNGKTVAEPAKPSATGYTFDGWFTDSNCTVAYNFSTAVTKDITLYAGWTKGNASGGAEGGTITLLPEEVRTKAQVDADHDAPDKTKNPPQDDAMRVKTLADAVDFADKGITILPKSQVQYVDSKGVEVKKTVDEVEYIGRITTGQVKEKNPATTGERGIKIVLASAGTIKLIAETGSTSDATRCLALYSMDGTEIQSIPSPNPAAEITFNEVPAGTYVIGPGNLGASAGGSSNIYKISVVTKGSGVKTYKVSYDLNNAAATGKPANENVEENAKATKPETTPVLDGYKFKFWSADKKTEFDFNTPITEAVTLYAVWEKTGSGSGSGSGADGCDVHEAFDVEFADGFETVVPFSGAKYTPGVAVKCAKCGKTLVVGTDYAVKYKNNSGKADVETTAEVTVTGKGNYVFTKTLTFKITKIDVKDAGYVSVKGLKIDKIAAQNFTGEAIEPTIKVVDKNKAEVDSSKFLTVYANNVNAGTATVTIFGAEEKGKVTSVKATFKINPVLVNSSKEGMKSLPVKSEDILDKGTTAAFSASGATAPINELKYGSYTLVEGKDFTYKYGNNKKITPADKPATVAVTFKGNFKGKADSVFQIVGTSDIQAFANTVAAGAKLGKANVYVFDADGNQLKANKDFAIEYETGVDANTVAEAGKDYTITIKKYTGKGTTNTLDESVNVPLTVTGVSKDDAKNNAIKKVTVLANGKQNPCKEYTGGKVELEAKDIAVEIANKAPTDNYDLVFAKNTNKGSATVYVIGKGTTTGMKKATFKIVPQNTKFVEN